MELSIYSSWIKTANIICVDYERDSEDNPADFFLDTIIKNEVTLDKAKQAPAGISMHAYIKVLATYVFFLCVYI